MGQYGRFGGSRDVLPLSSTRLLPLHEKLGALVQAMRREIEPGLRPAVIALSGA
jgi:hypothetical protein